MTNYSQQDYYNAGAVRVSDADWNENKDLDWGPYKWPSGVPSELMGKVKCRDGTVILVRKETTELWQLFIDYVEHSLGYGLGATEGGGYTGGYNNRPIAGTNTASAHSRARSIDFKAQENPQSRTFRSTWPPAAIALATQCGLYWGGFYIGAPYDTMHATVNTRKADVPANLEKMKSLTAGSGIIVKPANTAPVVDGGVSVGGVTARDVQQRLNELGHSVVVDGDFGPATLAAVQAFQTAHGLPADGWVGPDTWNAMNPAPGYPLSGNQIFGRWNEPAKDGVQWAKLTRSGDPRWDGDDVRTWIKMLQQRLIMHGVVPGISDPNSGWADGLYENPTTEAVRRFQAARGLAVDGMVGPQTWSSLWR